MVAVVFDADHSAAAAGQTGKGFFARVLDAVAYSQMKRAERQIARYSHLLPPNFDVQTRLWSRSGDEPRGGW